MIEYIFLSIFGLSCATSGFIYLSLWGTKILYAEKLKDLFDYIKIVDWGHVPEFDLIINATSLGLNENDEINLDFSRVGQNKLFYDVIYNPKETNFLKMGKKLGNKIENGKSMFIYQASAAFNLWHGVNPEFNNETLKLLD